jgi:hypothetical protein
MTPQCDSKQFARKILQRFTSTKGMIGGRLWQLRDDWDDSVTIQGRLVIRQMTEMPSDFREMTQIPSDFLHNDSNALAYSTYSQGNILMNT